ncbi:cilia- and flagella-associated protein 161-like [Cydia pomonella]|uniref:cilia- and flagella-associated protein 161-like n=1 Tax=Cydia pomonella TaxID=82600 RepID=UPI002ADDF72A|nr:cilia- and flagella-associated protein 161-like [Cydia pomonella]
MNPFDLETMKDGDIMLARYRKMNENLNAPTILTQAIGTIAFGDTISLLAPNVPATYPAKEDSKGLLLGGRLSSDELLFYRDLHDGCSLAGLPDLQPKAKSTFVITSADYSDRKSEHLKYNQEFLLTLSKSVDKKPLYVRFDPNPIPGLCGKFPLYLSENSMSNTRWRVLPVRAPNITRFEQEGKPVPINTDIVINHCATNINLGVDVDHWVHGFYEEIWPPLMKTCLDVYGRELPHNIWHIHVPVA